MRCLDIPEDVEGQLLSLIGVGYVFLAFHGCPNLVSQIDA